jgi:glycosyltransferase involved in cell wall biosynthesis
MNRPEVSTRRIKILHLITSLEVGGAQHGMLLGLPRFNLDRYEHIVCSLMDRMQMAEQFSRAGIEVRSLNLKRKTDLAVGWRLRSLIGEIRPDILHTYLLHSNVLGRVVGRLTGVPKIIGSERTIGQARRWGRLLTKLTNPLTDAVEVNSEIGAKAISADLGIPYSKIEVVRSGIDLTAYSTSNGRDETRASLGLTSDQHLVLYIGRLRRVKGVEYGLKAFALVLKEHPSAHMALAGEGDQLDSLMSLTNKLGISENVTFLGVRNDLPSILNSADSVLMPSLNEGFPRTAIESMAAGKPIVATRVGGTPEAIIDRETGILVGVRDVDAMSRAVSELINTPELRSRLGQAGRNRAQDNYSVEQYVSRLDGLYRELSGVPESDLGTTINFDSII